MVLLSVLFVSGYTSINQLTRPYADTLYCQLGSCTSTNTTINNTINGTIGIWENKSGVATYYGDVFIRDNLTVNNINFTTLSFNTDAPNAKVHVYKDDSNNAGFMTSSAANEPIEFNCANYAHMKYTGYVQPTAHDKSGYALFGSNSPLGNFNLTYFGGVFTYILLQNYNATIDTAVGHRILMVDHSGDINTGYGIYIQALAGTEKYGIYDTSNAQWYMNSQINATSLVTDGINISRNITFMSNGTLCLTEYDDGDIGWSRKC